MRLRQLDLVLSGVGVEVDGYFGLRVVGGIHFHIHAPVVDGFLVREGFDTFADLARASLDFEGDHFAEFSRLVLSLFRLQKLCLGSGQFLFSHTFSAGQLFSPAAR